MKKSARVSEKLVSPGLPGLHVATRQKETASRSHLATVSDPRVVRMSRS